jgi:hypothetical protein
MSIEKKLDEIMQSKAIARKVSATQTEECPIWSAFDELWIESDAQLRKRLKEEIEARTKK